MNDRLAVIARRIAICQHPHGEGVWWDTDSHPHPGCIQDCDCTPVEYVRADLHAGAVEALREIEAMTQRDDYPRYLIRRRVLDALTALNRHGGQS